MPYSNPAQKREYIQRSRRVARLWRSRRQRNAAPVLVTMLSQERTPQLRTGIIIALGRLEAPQALQPLQKLLAQVRRDQPVPGGRPANLMPGRDRVPPLALQLALGRIRSRGLRGERKLNVVAQSVGTNWLGIKRKAATLQARLGDRAERYSALNSDNYRIVQEFYDVLYRMGKRGENIRALGAFDLRLWPQPEPLLVAASLSDAAEVRFWLERAMPPRVTGFEPSHLLDLGPTVPAELMKYLRLCLAKAKANPRIMVDTAAYTSLFNAAAASGDRRFIPILKEFEKVNDRWTKISAQQAIERF